MLVSVKCSHRALLLFFAAGCLSGCGGAASAPAEHAEHAEPGAQHDSSLDQVDVSAEIGGMPVEATEYTFRQAFKGISQCFTDNTKQLEFIGGEIAVKVLVDSNGQVKHVFAERSTLGHDATEQCMFQALREESWPKPVGGLTGVAQNAFAFEMAEDIRPPVEWTDADVRPALEENASALAQCKGSAQGIIATLYVDTSGSALGVGLAGNDERVEAARECLVSVLSSATYPSPGSWPAKVSIQL